MNTNTTLGEVKALCIEATKRYGDDKCCDHCDFYTECGETPEMWELDGDGTVTVPGFLFDHEDDTPMTVQKLIAYLSLCNPDFPVYFEGNKIECVSEHRNITDPDQSHVNLT